MADFNSNRFQSKRQTYETPEDLFRPLADEFQFTLDVAADAGNAKCAEFFDEAADGLAQPWRGVCWCNPPYREQSKWVKKAFAEAQAGRPSTGTAGQILRLHRTTSIDSNSSPRAAKQPTEVRNKLAARRALRILTHRRIERRSATRKKNQEQRRANERQIAQRVLPSAFAALLPHEKKSDEFAAPCEGIL